MPQAIRYSPTAWPSVGLVRDLVRVELLERPERQPERAVRRERDRAERVAGAELPHAGEQLRQAAVGQRQAEHDRLARLAHEPGVEHAEHERRQRERGQAERPGIGDLGNGSVTQKRGRPRA